MSEPLKRCDACSCNPFCGCECHRRAGLLTEQERETVKRALDVLRHKYVYRTHDPDDNNPVVTACVDLLAPLAKEEKHGGV